jgi:hypothetical protein
MEVERIPVGSSFVLRFHQAETADVLVLWTYPTGAVSMHREVDGRRVPVVTPRADADGSVDPSLAAIAEEQPPGWYVASLRNLSDEISPTTYLALYFDLQPDCTTLTTGVERG